MPRVMKQATAFFLLGILQQACSVKVQQSRLLRKADTVKHVRSASSVDAEAECKCVNGYGSKGETCENVTGGSDCASCFGGYSRTDSEPHTCEQNVCVCDHGMPAAGPSCHDDGRHLCEYNSCHSGYASVWVSGYASVWVDGGYTCEAQCNCVNGHGSIGETCENVTGGSDCASCFRGYSRTDSEPHTCEQNVCECDHGMPAVGQSCHTNGSHHCEHNACHLGYGRGHVDGGNYQCEVECKCVNGRGSKGEQCEHATGGSDCVGCQSGFSLTDSEPSTCEENVCLCKGGEPKVGPHCYHKARCDSDSCDPGNVWDYADGGTCKTQCTCVHGRGNKDDVDCAIPCKSCYTGYSLAADGTCEVNVCECEHGHPGTGYHCRTPGKGCDACFPGYGQVHNWTEGTVTCEAQCTCVNGHGAFNKHCEKPCQWCSPGYGRSESGKCEKYKCNCSNGVARKGSECNSNEAGCDTCDEGYILEYNNDYMYYPHISSGPSCTSIGGKAQDQCTCANGTPNSKAMYDANCAKPCQRCDSGYSLAVDYQSCEANVCNCKNGLPGTLSNCQDSGREGCDSCNEGYGFLSTWTHTYCKKQCSCANGTGVFGTDCRKQCRKCDKGYTKTRDPTTQDGYPFTCQANTCTCDNGKGTSGSACKQNGEPNCTSCNDQFHLFYQEGFATNICVKDCVQEGCKTCSVRDSCTACKTNQGYFQEGDTDGANVKCTACTQQGCETCWADSCTVCKTSEGYFQEALSDDIVTCEECDVEHCAVCTSVGVTQCDMCNAGYRLNSNSDNNLCELIVEPTEGEGDAKPQMNQCTCSNGAATTPCVQHGAADCASCDAGYHLEGTGAHTCEANQCNCDNGLAPTHTMCQTHGAEQCKACNRGFHITPEHKCEAYKCTCDGGTVSPTCPSNSTELCESCDDGYYFLESYATCEHCSIKHGVFCTACTATECTKEVAREHPIVEKGVEASNHEPEIANEKVPTKVVNEKVPQPEVSNHELAIANEKVPTEVVNEKVPQPEVAGELPIVGHGVQASHIHTGSVRRRQVP